MNAPDVVDIEASQLLEEYELNDSFVGKQENFDFENSKLQKKNDVSNKNNQRKQIMIEEIE